MSFNPVLSLGFMSSPSLPYFHSLTVVSCDLKPKMKREQVISRFIQIGIWGAVLYVQRENSELPTAYNYSRAISVEKVASKVHRRRGITRGGTALLFSLQKKREKGSDTFLLSLPDYNFLKRLKQFFKFSKLCQLPTQWPLLTVLPAKTNKQGVESWSRRPGQCWDYLGQEANPPMSSLRHQCRPTDLLLVLYSQRD